MTTDDHSLPLQFHQEQLKSIWSEMSVVLREIWATEKYAVAATGGIWAFLFKDQQQSSWLAWWIPVLVVAICIVRSWALLWRISQMQDYVFRAEESATKISHTDSPFHGLIGWEHFVTRPGLKPVVRSSSVTIWVVLVFCTVAVAVFEGHRQHPILLGFGADVTALLGHFLFMRMLRSHWPKMRSPKW
jgi:hypothetical protein